MEQIRKMFVQNYLSYVYEELCREKMWVFSSGNLWNYRFDRLGRYWGPVCGEVDILGIDTAGGNMIIGECKYSAAEKGLTILHTLKEKARALEAKTGCSCSDYVVFSTSGFTKGLKDEAAGNSNILLVDTFSPNRD